MPRCVLGRFPELLPLAASFGVAHLGGHIRLDLRSRQLVLTPLLGQGHQLFDERSQLLGLGQRGHNPTGNLGPCRIVLILVQRANQAARHVSQHGTAVRRTAAQLAASDSVSHRSVFALRPIGVSGCISGCVRLVCGIRTVTSWPPSCPDAGSTIRVVPGLHPKSFRQSFSPSATRPPTSPQDPAPW